MAFEYGTNGPEFTAHFALFLPRLVLISFE